jgi:ParB-like chromosome segregation protein Spo0J
MKSKESKESKRLEIVYLSASALVKLPGNPRRDKDPKAVERLSKLIQLHGFQNPLQVFAENGKYTILCGNHRFDAGLSLGMTEFPCIVYTGDRKAALARAISDNRSNEWTEWDVPIMKDLILELDTGDFDIHLTGFDTHEIELMMTAFRVDETDAPALNDGDRAPFIQMTFTLHDSQAEELNAAINKAKSEGGGESAVNENSNGNALTFIAQRFNRG